LPRRCHAIISPDDAPHAVDAITLFFIFALRYYCHVAFADALFTAVVSAISLRRHGCFHASFFAIIRLLSLHFATVTLPTFSPRFGFRDAAIS